MSLLWQSIRTINLRRLRKSKKICGNMSQTEFELRPSTLVCRTMTLLLYRRVERIWEFGSVFWKSLWSYGHPEPGVSVWLLASVIHAVGITWDCSASQRTIRCHEDNSNEIFGKHCVEGANTLIFLFRSQRVWWNRNICADQNLDLSQNLKRPETVICADLPVQTNPNVCGTIATVSTSLAYSQTYAQT
jgi:hypothetical protein